MSLYAYTKVVTLFIKSPFLLLTLHLSNSKVFVKPVHSCMTEQIKGETVTGEIAQILKTPWISTNSQIRVLVHTKSKYIPQFTATHYERSNLRAEAVLAQGRQEREQTGLWTNPPSIFLSVTAPPAKWRCFPFSSVCKKSDIFLHACVT